MKDVKHTVFRTPFLDVAMSPRPTPAVTTVAPFTHAAPAPGARSENLSRANPDEEFDSPPVATATRAASLTVVRDGVRARTEHASDEPGEPDDGLQILDESSRDTDRGDDLAVLDEAWHDDPTVLDESWHDEPTVLGESWHDDSALRARSSQGEPDEEWHGDSPASFATPAGTAPGLGNAHDTDPELLAELEEGENDEDPADAVVDRVGLELGEMREPVLDALRAGRHGSAVRLAIRAGIDNETRLTDMVLLARHPELLYRPPIATEFDFEERDSIFRQIFRTVDAVRAGVGRGISSVVPAPAVPGMFAGIGALAAGRGAATGATAKLTRKKPTRASGRSDSTGDPVRRLVCTNDDVNRIGQVVSRAVSTEQLRQGLLEAVSQAATFARATGDQLRRASLRSGDVHAARTNAAFRAAFGVDPDFVPRWRPRGATWNRGDVVRARLNRIATMLDNGSTSYLCWGPRHSPELQWRPHNRSYVRKGTFAIHFGPGFWTDWANGDIVSMAATLIRNLLILHYDTIVPSNPRSHFGTAACYVRFVLEAAGQKPPERSVRMCAASLR